jgi:hypothetical protein
MSEELRTLLRSELSEERPPPLGDIVGIAVRDGRRIRRVRRFGVIGTGIAVAGVVAVAVAFAGPFAMSGTGHAPAVQAAAPPAAAVDGKAVDGKAAEAKAVKAKAVKATPAAVLELLTRLAPLGPQSGFAQATDQLGAQLYVDRGQGPAMVRVFVSKEGRAHGPRGDKPTFTVSRLPDNCIQDLVVNARWTDGTMVQVDGATCLAWDGKQNKPTLPLLNPAEAIRIATDPHWGVTMDPDLVAAGAKHFPDLPTFS